MSRRAYLEKRQPRRLSMIVMADLSSMDGKKMFGRGCITDVSIGGLQIETKEELPLPENAMVVSLNFYLPIGMGFISVQGHLRRASKEMAYQYGVQFTEIRWFDRLRLW